MNIDLTPEQIDHAEMRHAVEKVAMFEVQLRELGLFRPLEALQEKEKRIKYLEGRISDILIFLQNPTEYPLLRPETDSPMVHVTMERIVQIVRPIKREEDADK